MTWRMDHLMKRIVEKPFVADSGRIAIGSAIDEQRPEATAVPTDPTLAGLLRAVLAEPGDDFARLVYADAMEERGEADRSEFVRVQCRLAALPDEIGRVRQHEHRAQSYAGGHMNPAYFCPLCNRETDLLQEAYDLRRREQELLGPRWGDWLGPAVADGAVCLNLNPFGPGETNGWLGVSYGRGFVESVVCTAADWLRHADAILVAHPVREVTLTTDPHVSITDWENMEEVRLCFPGGDVPPLAVNLLRQPRNMNYLEYVRASVAAHLSRRWPGITFRLPGDVP